MVGGADKEEEYPCDVPKLGHDVEDKLGSKDPRGRGEKLLKGREIKDKKLLGRQKLGLPKKCCMHFVNYVMFTWPLHIKRLSMENRARALHTTSKLVR